MENLKIRKWWWAWQFERIETWLEERAAEGYVVTKVTGLGDVFHFEKTAPKRIRYCVDYQSKLTREYEQLLKDDGWTCIEIPGSWILCWKEYTDVRPELFNEYDTIINRNNRIISILLLLFLPGFFLIRFFSEDYLNTGIFFIPFIIMFLGVTVFYVFAIANLLVTNSTLRKKKKLQNR